MSYSLLFLVPGLCLVYSKALDKYLLINITQEKTSDFQAQECGLCTVGEQKPLVRAPLGPVYVQALAASAAWITLSSFKEGS